MSKTHLPHVGMRRNLSRLASGAILSQILMVASTPFLTRIYNPDAFGVMAAFSAAYAIAIPITTLKYDAAVILPKAEYSAISITTLVVFISSGVALLIGGLLWGANRLALLPDGIAINLWLPLALWLGALYTLAQQWSARRSDYKYFARSQVIGSVVNIGTCLSMGLFFGGGHTHLVIGFVCGMACSFLYVFLSQTKKINFRCKLNVKRLLRRANVYRQFPVLVLPSALLMTVAQNSTPLLLTAYYPVSDVGQFAIANRLLLIPAALIGGALAESFRSEFVRRQRDRLDLTSLFNKTFRTLVLFAIPVFSLLFVAAPWLFTVVFGSEYVDAGLVCRAVVIGVAAQFLGNPFSSVFVSLRKSATGLRVHIISTVIPLVLLWCAAALQLPIMIALGIYSASTTLSILMMMVVAHRLCNAADGLNRKMQSV